MVVPLRQMCPHAELLLGRAVARDPEAGPSTAETLGGTFEIGYERLVVALGAVPRTFPVPGLAQHGRGFKDVADAIALRNRLLRSLESAAARLDRGEAERDLGFVFVGAGYAGSRRWRSSRTSHRRPCGAGTPTLREVEAALGPRRRRRPDPPGDPAQARRVHAELPRAAGDRDSVGTTLASFDGADAILSDGTRVPARTLVWAAGVRAHPDLGLLRLPLDDRGRVTVGPTLQVEGATDVWALGDGAAVPNERTPGRFDPPTCQHALRQARRLAKNLHGTPRPYGYRMLGQVATLGRYKGIAELPGLRLRGFPGWFVARTYHLFALPTVRRKIRVVTDWTVSLFFRRDIVELSALGHPRRLDG